MLGLDLNRIWLMCVGDGWFSILEIMEELIKLVHLHILSFRSSRKMNQIFIYL